VKTDGGAGPPKIGHPKATHVNASGAQGVAVGENIRQVNHFASRGRVARSAYAALAQSLAPTVLLDREDELANLADFCLGEEPYVWWQADPWAGKTALLATFTLHPPQEVDVVSFFVTSRLLGQADSLAYTDAVLEQLASLLGEDLPTSDAATVKDAHRSELLQAAVEQAQASHRRLVLVVDGLDEDLSQQAGLPSIASLLPRDTQGAIRVIVAGRPFPGTPSDVPGDHPLRNCRRRTLSPSRHSVDKARAASEELRRLISGPSAHRDVLGFIVASGGGLSGDDLAELTDTTVGQLEHLLQGIAGRTISSREDVPSISGSPTTVYLVTHDVLQAQAMAAFGEVKIAEYHSRIHAWADKYAELGWPQATPPYLQSRYSYLLHATKDIDRLLDLVLDARRLDRMLQETGGDASALTEIRAAMAFLQSQSPVRLADLLRLSMHHKDINERNISVPPRIVAVWTELGEVIRAEAIARSIPGIAARTEALLYLKIDGVTARGNNSRELMEEITATIRSIEDAGTQALAMHHLVKQLIRTGRVNLADEIVREIRTFQRIPLMVEIVRKLMAEGDSERAYQLVSDLKILSGSLENLDLKFRSVRHLASANDAIGNHDLAEALAHGIEDAEDKASTILDLADSAAIDRPHRAISFIRNARSILNNEPNTARSGAILIRIAVSMARGGQIVSAREYVQTIPRPHDQARALLEMAETLFNTQHRETAVELADEVESFVLRIEKMIGRDGIISGLCLLRARLGDLDHAEQLSQSISSVNQQATTLAHLAQASLDAGDRERAERLAVEVSVLARSVERPYRKTSEIGEFASVMASIGDHEVASRLVELLPEKSTRATLLTRLAEERENSSDCEQADIYAHATVNQSNYHGRRIFLVLAEARTATATPEEAERLIDQLPDPIRAEALQQYATRLSSSGQHEQAERIARSMPSPIERTRVVRTLIDTRVANKDYAHAHRLVMLMDDFSRPAAIVQIATAQAASGDPESAETLIRLIDPYRLPQALSQFALARASAGEFEPAESLIRSIEDTDERVHSMVLLADDVTADRRVDSVRLALESSSLVRDLRDRGSQVTMLIDIARILAKADETQSSEQLLADVEALLRYTSGSAGQQICWQVNLAKAFMTARHEDRALHLMDRTETLARSIDDPKRQIRELANIANTYTELRFHEAYSALIESITDHSLCTEGLSLIADHLTTASLYDEAREIIGLIPDPHIRAETTIRLAKDLSCKGEVLEAEGLIRSISPLRDRARALKELAFFVADLGRKSDAEGLIKSLPSPWDRAAGLSALCQKYSAQGANDRAEELAARITDDYHQGQALRLLTRRRILIQDHTGAEQLARSIRNTRSRVEELLNVAASRIDLSEIAQALRLVLEAEKLLQTSGEAKSQLMGEIARLLLILHRPQHAQKIAVKILADGDWLHAVSIVASLTPDTLKKITQERFKNTEWFSNSDFPPPR
jgi:hypothetical protein